MCRGPVKKYVGFHSPPLGPIPGADGLSTGTDDVLPPGHCCRSGNRRTGKRSGNGWTGAQKREGGGEFGEKIPHPSPLPRPYHPPIPPGGSHRPSPCPSPIPLPTPFTLLTPFALPTLLALLSPIAHHPSPITPLPLPKAPIQSAHSPALAPPTHHSPPCSSTIHPSLTHPSPIPRPSPKKKVAGRFLAQRPRPPAFSPSPYFVIADSCGLS